jgi:hypothetical protein
MISQMSHGRLIFFLIILAYAFLMFGNGAISLTHPDEVFYIQTAKEMMERNSWATPYIFDAPQFEKPILTYWLLILALKIFGITAFGARFIPALLAMFDMTDSPNSRFARYKEASLSPRPYSTNFLNNSCLVVIYDNSIAHASTY